MADEPKKSGAEKRYGDKGEKKPEAAKEAPAAAEAEAASEGDKGKPGDDHADMRAAMVKRHEKEMRDMHGQHRDAMRQMHARHSDEASQMMQAPAGAPDGDQDQMGAGGGEAA